MTSSRDYVTYIMGARCKDGLVIVSDSRLATGNDISRGDKIFQPISNVVIGASGNAGVFTKFSRQINEGVENRQVRSWDDLMTVVEDLTLRLNQRYLERTSEPIEVLMGIQDSEDNAKLYLVSSHGVAQEITKVVAIGHAEPYGSLFLKTMWSNDVTMRQAAELGAFVIYAISELEIDNSVDNLVQLWYVPYNGDAHRAESSETAEISRKSFMMFMVFTNYLENLLTSNPGINKQ